MRIKSKLKEYPKLLLIARFIYSNVFRFLGWTKHVTYPMSHNGFISINSYLPELYKEYETFGGYYDKNLVNGSFVIVNIALAPTEKTPSSTKPIKLLVVNIKNKNIVYEKDVLSYNWQQGCRAHWINPSILIYNNYDPNTKNYFCETFDISCFKVVKRYNMPVQDSYGGNFFISINYERLNVLRPDYGYRNNPQMSVSELENLDNDGIWIVNMENGNTKMIISLSDIKAFGNDPISLGEKIHKANHVMISPDGVHMVFVHRCYPQGKRYDRLILADVDGKMIRVLSTGIVSHYCWVDSGHLFGFFNNKKGMPCYNMVDIVEGKLTEVNIPQYASSGDGHPTSNSEFIVTDCYPDKYGYQHLIKYDYKQGEVKDIAQFYHPKRYKGQSRCDLHPRVTVDGTITLDSVDNGKRKMYISTDNCDD